MRKSIQLLAILALPALAGCASTEGGYPPGYYSGGGYYAPYYRGGYFDDNRYGRRYRDDDAYRHRRRYDGGGWEGAPGGDSRGERRSVGPYRIDGPPPGGIVEAPRGIPAPSPHAPQSNYAPPRSYSEPSAPPTFRRSPEAPVPSIGGGSLAQ